MKIKRSKGQMQMGESIAIIIIVLILLIFGLVFYSKVKEASITEKKSLFQELDVVELSQIAYSLPEIQCSFAKSEDFGCIDLLKFKYLKKIIDSSFQDSGKEYFYYRELFGTANISIQKILNNGTNETFVLYDTNKSLANKDTVFMPVVAYDPLTDKNFFAVLKVEKNV